MLEAAGKVAASRVAITAVSGGAAATGATAIAEAPEPAAWAPTISAPPDAIRESATNLGQWKGLGETLNAFGTFAYAQPYLVTAIVGTALVLIFGPRLARRMGWSA